MMKNGKRETREGYLRIFIPLCASDFCLFLSTMMCSYTSNEYGHDVFWDLTFPNKTVSNSSEEVVCDTDTSPQGYQGKEIVQKAVARWNLFISIAHGVPLLISSLLLSPLSDFMGRRPFLFLGMFGICIKQLLMTVAIIFQWDVYFFIPFTTIDGFCGSWVVQLAIALSVVSDLRTAGKTRSYLITVFSFVFGVGFSLGTFLSGFFVELLGYEYSMATSCGVAALGFIITCFIPETLTKSERKQHHFSCMGNFKDILKFYTTDDLTYPNSTRWKYITSVCSLIFVMLGRLGSYAFETLYLLDSPFCFSPEKISIFETAKTCLSEVIILVGIKAMQQCLTDETIAFLGTTSAMCCFVLFGIALSPMYLYIAVVGSMGMSALPMIRGIMSKMTPPHNQGAMFGSLAVVENICNLLGSVLGSAIYSENVSFYKGTAYLVFAGFMSIALILLLFLVKDSIRKHHLREYSPIP
ncbi:solute carrier family 46 member 3-like isoform X2 [Ostrea edulis]|uniref:solute carrier family 46 member 3-like isoform X2 n=1 Tax=Ostrea edulis TaxID=37623 RepID=UPI0024AFFD1E|nr:solute carrier family 46 member 3-like isoform X2 [Ostrea edulis]